MQVRLINKKNNAIVLVKGGKMYDEATMIELPNNIPAVKGAFKFIERKMKQLWRQMGQIDPVWGDLEVYHELEKEWLTYRAALYGE